MIMDQDAEKKFLTKFYEIIDCSNFLDNFNDAKKRIKKLMRLYMVWEILPVLDINLHPIAVDLTLIFVLNLVSFY